MVSPGARDGYMAESATTTSPWHLGSHQEWKTEKSNPVQGKRRNNALATQANLGTIETTQEDEESTSLGYPPAAFSSISLSQSINAEAGVINADSSSWTTNASLGSSQLTVQKSDNESVCEECKESSLHSRTIRSHSLAQFLFLPSKQASLDTLESFPSSQEKFLDQINQPNAFPCQSLRNGSFLATTELENGREEMKTRAQPKTLPIRGPKRLDSATSAEWSESDGAIGSNKKFVRL